MRSSHTGSSGSRHVLQFLSGRDRLTGSCDDQCSYACVAIKNEKTGANRQRLHSTCHTPRSQLTHASRVAQRSTRASQRKSQWPTHGYESAEHSNRARTPATARCASARLAGDWQAARGRTRRDPLFFSPAPTPRRTSSAPSCTARRQCRLKANAAHRVETCARGFDLCQQRAGKEWCGSVRPRSRSEWREEGRSGSRSRSRWLLT